MRSTLVFAAALLACFAHGQTKAATQQSFSVHGVVVDEAGRALAGVAIGVSHEWQKTLPADITGAPLATTAADGTFVLTVKSEACPDNTDALWFVAPGRVHVQCSLAAANPATIVLPKAGVLAGRVVDRTGKALPGVRLVARDWLSTANYLGNRRFSQAKPWTATVTQPNGRFVIAGAYTDAAVLTIDEPGLRGEVGPIAAGEPIELVAERSPTAVVEVSDGDGTPIADALVIVRTSIRNGCGRTQAVRTDERGTAHVNLLADPCWLEAGHEGRDGWLSAVSTVKANTGRVQMQLRPPVQRWSVRAVDPAGRPVPTFSVALLVDLGAAQGISEVQSLQSFARRAVTAHDGIATVLFDPVHDDEPPAAIVSADGYALARHVTASGQAYIASLVPAIPIHGTVVDAKTGALLAGARVWSLPEQEDLEWYKKNVDYLDPVLGVAVTGADGAFQILNAGPGAQRVYCYMPGHSQVEPVRLTLIAGTPPAKVQLVLPTPQTFTIATGLVAPPVGATLHFCPPTSLAPMEVASSQSRTVPLAADGTGVVQALPPGDYEVALRMPTSPREWGQSTTVLSTLHVGNGQTAVTVDGNMARPALVRGNIHSKVPFGRLAVVSAAKSGPISPSNRYLGPISPVAIDGSFHLPEPPGERSLLVIDLLTGVTLAKTDFIKVPNARERTVDLTVDAIVVCVHIETHGVGLDDNYGIDVCMEPETIAAPRSMNLGVRLRPGWTSLQLYLPRTTSRLRLLHCIDLLDSRDSNAIVDEVAVDLTDSCKPVTLTMPAGK